MRRPSIRHSPMTGGQVHSDKTVPGSVQKPARGQGPGPDEWGVWPGRAARQQELGSSGAEQ